MDLMTSYDDWDDWDALGIKLHYEHLGPMSRDVKGLGRKW